MEEQGIRLELEKWRGLSAYEVAVQNGFNGTQSEWLESLAGGTLQITVCGKNVGTDGNIVLYANDILMEDGALNTVKTKMEAIEEQLNAPEETLSIAKGGTGATTAAQARASLGITPANIGAAVKKTATAALAAGSWSGGRQTVSVSGVTASNAVIVTPAPASYVAWSECMVRCTAQAGGTLTFAAEDTPDVALTANVLILE